MRDDAEAAMQEAARTSHTLGEILLDHRTTEEKVKGAAKNAPFWVIAIMMISVTERTREIGVRKALGARRREILWQFLVEAATLTLIGGVIGMALGGAIAFGVKQFTPIPASVPLWSIAAALGASIVTGVGFGLYPAAKAARLDPVEALRYE